MLSRPADRTVGRSAQDAPTTGEHLSRAISRARRRTPRSGALCLNPLRLDAIEAHRLENQQRRAYPANSCQRIGARTSLSARTRGRSFVGRPGSPSDLAPWRTQTRILSRGQIPNRGRMSHLGQGCEYRARFAKHMLCAIHDQLQIAPARYEVHTPPKDGL